MRSTLAAACVLVSLLAITSQARALEIVRTSSGASPLLRAELQGQIFVRLRGAKIPGGEWSRRLALQRARLELKMELDERVRLVLEPDFAGADADLADAYLELEPFDGLELRAGQFKSPYGVLELIGRWNLPSLTRGLSSEIVTERLGFGGREIGVLGELRLKELPLKPRFEVGAFGELSGDNGADVAARLELRLVKGFEAHAAWYTSADARIRGRRGHAGALTALYERHGWFATIEGQYGRARLLRQDGVSSEADAEFLVVRSLAAVRLPIVEGFDVEPFVAVEVVDPNVTTRDDRGLDLRGGANLRWHDAVRLGFEVDVQRGELAFVVPDQIALIALLGVNLE